MQWLQQRQLLTSAFYTTQKREKVVTEVLVRCLSEVKWSCLVVSDFGTPWTATYQGPLSMGLGQEYWWVAFSFSRSKMCLRCPSIGAVEATYSALDHAQGWGDRKILLSLGWARCLFSGANGWVSFSGSTEIIKTESGTDGSIKWWWRVHYKAAEVKTGLC